MSVGFASLIITNQLIIDIFLLIFVDKQQKHSIGRIGQFANLYLNLRRTEHLNFILIKAHLCLWFTTQFNLKQKGVEKWCDPEFVPECTRFCVMSSQAHRLFPRERRIDCCVWQFAYENNCKFEFMCTLSVSSSHQGKRQSSPSNLSVKLSRLPALLSSLMKKTVFIPKWVKEKRRKPLEVTLATFFI